MSVTAKVLLSSKEDLGRAGMNQTRLDFTPDYADGSNKEWAAATPSLALSMCVIASVAEIFETGQSYTLTFDKTDSDS